MTASGPISPRESAPVPDRRSSPGHAYPPLPPTPATPHSRAPKEPPSDYSLSIPTLAYSANARDEPEFDEGDKDEATASTTDVRAVLRTPSPTPSEARVLESKTKILGDWRAYLKWRRYANRRGILTLVASLAGLIFVILFLVFQRRIVDKLQPTARLLHDTPGGWLIPIAIMFVISFPPLFGHEIIAVLCGDVWGVWIGFGIVAAGTLLGELGNFYAFKLFCNARGKRLEERRLSWALYAQVVREGGLVVPTIMRLTFIPGHLLTAIFSTCGMNVWGFFVSATLSLPKQLAVVYIGVAQNSGGNDTVTGAIKAVVILATLAMTYIAMRFVNKKVDEVKNKVVYARRKQRQARMLRGEDPLPGSGGGDALEAQPEIALRPPTPQDPSGRRVSTSASASTSGGPLVYVPAPQRALSRGALEAETHRPGPGRKSVRKMLGLGARKKRGSDASNADVDVDGGVLGAGDVVELEMGERTGALRARRHTEDAMDSGAGGMGRA